LRKLKTEKIPLDQIPLHAEARIVALEGLPASNRFMELGITPGTKVKILFLSPGGNLAALYLDDSFCLSLRCEDLKKIYVNITPSE
jgi:Fe2+ transport system protein FeoA